MKKISELMCLSGNSALITGAAGNLGLPMAETIAELGGDLFLVDRPGVEYSAKYEKIKNDYGINIEYLPCDLEIEMDRKRLIEHMIKKNTNLKILVNNAAFVGTSKLDEWVGDFENQSLEAWRRALEVNLTAIFHLSKGLLSVLKKNSMSSIINIGSIYGEYGPDNGLYEGTDMGNPAGYAASKGGLIQLTRWMATTLAPHIRVNAISPGGVYRNQPKIFVDKYTKKVPMARMACEEDIKGSIAYLASDLSSYVTGQNLKVDGGWGVW